VSLYGRSKLLAEEIVLQYSRKVPVVIIRPPNVLGIRQKELTLILDLLKWRLFPEIGGRGMKTSIIFVQDLVRALLTAAQHRRAVGKTYFVTDGSVYSWMEMLESLAREMGVYPHVIRIPYPVLFTFAAVSQGISKMLRIPAMADLETLRQSREYCWTYDSIKITEELDFTPQIKFHEGLRDIVAEWRNKRTGKC
jgi:nucleoside-diphosphate-sugar epimerase